MTGTASAQCCSVEHFAESANPCRPAEKPPRVFSGIPNRTCCGEPSLKLAPQRMLQAAFGRRKQEIWAEPLYVPVAGKGVVLNVSALADHVGRTGGGNDQPAALDRLGARAAPLGSASANRGPAPLPRRRKWRAWQPSVMDILGVLVLCTRSAPVLTPPRRSPSFSRPFGKLGGFPDDAPKLRIVAFRRERSPNPTSTRACLLLLGHANPAVSGRGIASLGDRC